MKQVMILLFLMAPVATFAQYIGHPAGYMRSGGETALQSGKDLDALTLWFGLTNESDIDVDYSRRVGGAGRTKHARFKEVIGAGTLSAILMQPTDDLPFGLVLEGVIGGQAQTIDDRRLPRDPYDNAGGILAGLGLKAHVSPVNRLRLGIGGKVTGSYSCDMLYGDVLNEFEDFVKKNDYDHHSVEMWLLRSQIFAGGGYDIPVYEQLVLSPYAGAGLGFMNGLASAVTKPFDIIGRLTRDTRDTIARIDERRRGFFFAGLDFHLLQDFSLSVEGQGNGKDWFAGIGFKFQPGKP